MKQMKTLNELLDELKRISYDFRNIQLACGYYDCSDLSCLDIPMQDAEGLFLWNELQVIMEKLDDAQSAIAYLSCPVQAEGVLRMGKNDRYCLKGTELPCGSSVEILVEDDYHDVPYWCRGRLEHSDKGYYFTGAKKTRLKGAKARIR